MGNSTQQFKIFKKECERMIERLGLKDWDISIVEDELEAPEDDAAETFMDHQGRIAKICWNSKNDKKIDPVIIARHECAHILIEPLAYIAEERYTTKQEIDNILEKIVTVLEKIIK